jgi:hypothetical protein
MQSLRHFDAQRPAEEVVEVVVRIFALKLKNSRLVGPLQRYVKGRTELAKRGHF